MFNSRRPPGRSLYAQSLQGSTARRDLFHSLHSSVVNERNAETPQRTLAPIKRHITMSCNKARGLIASVNKYLQTSNHTAEPTAKDMKKVDNMLLAVKQVEYHLTGMEQYIDRKFDQDPLRFSLQKLSYHREVMDTVTQNSARDLTIEIERIRASLEAIINPSGYAISQFIPKLSNTQHSNRAAQPLKAAPLPAAQRLLSDNEKAVMVDSAIQNDPEQFHGTAPLTAPPRLVNNKAEMVDKTMNVSNATQNSERASTDPQLVALKQQMALFKKQQEQDELYNRTLLQRIKELEIAAEQQQIMSSIQQQQSSTANSPHISAGDHQKAPTAQHPKPQFMDNVPSQCSNESSQQAREDRELLIGMKTAMEQVAHTNQTFAHTTERLLEQQAQQTAMTAKMLNELPTQLKQGLLEAAYDDGAGNRSRTTDWTYVNEFQNLGNELGEDAWNLPRMEAPSQPPQVTNPYAKQHPPHHANKTGLRLDTVLKVLQPYDGSTSIDTFQTQFISCIESNPELNYEQKYLVLQNLLTGTAKTCLVPMTDSAEIAIRMTFKMLRKVYAKDNTRQSLLDKLTKLPFHQIDPKQMKTDLVAHTVIAEQLKSKGIESTDDRLYGPIAAKLPPTIRQQVLLFMTRYGDFVRVEEVLEEIETHIDSLATAQTIKRYNYNPTLNEIALNEIPTSHAVVNYAKTTAKDSEQKSAQKTQRPLAYIPADHKAAYLDPTTKATLPGYYAPGEGGVNLNIIPRSFTFTNNEHSTCKVCMGKHHEMRCTLSSAEFRNKLQEKSLCPICINEHPITDCTSLWKCAYCDGTHHMGGCPQKEHYRNMDNYPVEASAPITFFRDQRRH